jgi:hypothetical protein
MQKSIVPYFFIEFIHNNIHDMIKLSDYLYDHYGKNRVGITRIEFEKYCEECCIDEKFADEIFKYLFDADIIGCPNGGLMYCRRMVFKQLVRDIYRRPVKICVSSEFNKMINTLVADYNLTPFVSYIDKIQYIIGFKESTDDAVLNMVAITTAAKQYTTKDYHMGYERVFKVLDFSEFYKLMEM